MYGSNRNWFQSGLKRPTALLYDSVYYSQLAVLFACIAAAWILGTYLALDFIPVMLEIPQAALLATTFGAFLFFAKVIQRRAEERAGYYLIPNSPLVQFDKRVIRNYVVPAVAFCLFVAWTFIWPHYVRSSAQYFVVLAIGLLFGKMTGLLEGDRTVFYPILDLEIYEMREAGKFPLDAFASGRLVTWHGVPYVVTRLDVRKARAQIMHAYPKDDTLDIIRTVALTELVPADK